MAKSVVAITKGTDAEKMVAEALTLLGGVENLIKPGSVVAIKPNSIIGRAPETSMNTSPAVVGAVIKTLRKAKPKEIILFEAGFKGLESFKSNGQKKAAEDAGVDRIINIAEEKDQIKMPIRDHRGGVDYIMLPRFLVEADHFVDLPIFKTHVSMMFTSALKNLFGVLSREDRQRFHWSTVSKGLMDIWSICRADLSIVDMIRPLEGFGPLAGLPTDFGCIVAGKDPVAVDATCCRMVGLDITKVPYFDAILDRHLGNYAVKDIEIRGKKIKEVYKKIWTPYLEDLAEKYPEYEICKHEGSCFLCEGLIAWSLERLKPMGEYEKNAGMSIVTGRAKKLPKKDPKDIILMGNCIPEKLRDKGIFVGGCPPWEFLPAWPIIERRRIDTMDGWGRDYGAEQFVFMEYEKGLRKKALSKSKDRKKK